MHFGRLLLATAAGFGALYAALLFYELDMAPPGCCGLTWPTPDPIAAERTMTADPKGTTAAIQRKTALAQLASQPGQPYGWMRFAAADRMANGHLTDAGVKALDMSYQMAPYAYRQTPWRVAFALDNWSALTPAVRMEVLQEIEIAKKPTQDQVLLPTRKAAALVTDPSGRRTAALLGLR